MRRRRYQNGFYYGLGDSFPLDYVFSGATMVYQATFGGWHAPPTWKQATDGLRSAAWGSFDVLGDEENSNSGSIFYRIAARNDFNSINDVKSTMDGIVQSVGFPLQASMVRFLSNPRRDGGTQPPVGTPGVDPGAVVLPPAAGNVNTKTTPGIFDVGSAADWWQQLVGLHLDLPDLPNIDPKWVLIGGVAIVAFFVLKK